MAKPNLCMCGCGTPVANKWVRGHQARGQGGYRLASVPPPDSPAWDEAGILDVGELVPDAAPDPETLPGDGAPPADGRDSGNDGPAGQLPPGPDDPPRHSSRDWRRSPKQQRARVPRITQAIRGDIDAKISLMLEIPGRVWEARDPVCGGTFVAQRPDISGALTDIVCQSPDLVAWFAGSGGQFMLWLNVMAACWPVLTVVMAHHVYHSVEAGPYEQQPDAARYAA